MQYKHNQICTTGKDISIGQEYQYCEDDDVYAVRLLGDTTDADMLRFDFEILAGPEQGTRFSCSAIHGDYAYGGMWRLYDAGTYPLSPPAAEGSP